LNNKGDEKKGFTVMNKLTLDQQKGITIDDLSVVILRLLMGKSSPQPLWSNDVSVHWILHQVAEPSAPQATYNSEFRVKVYEAVHKLITENLMMDDPFLPPYGFKGKDEKVRLTQKGSEVDIDGEITWEITPAKDYVNMILRRCGKLDKIAELYLEESYRSCQNGLVLSSVFLLGAVCERLVLLLADHLERLLRIPNPKNFRTNTIKISIVEVEVKKHLSELENKFKGSKTEVANIRSIKRSLDSLFAIYKECRNDVGHPDDNKPDITLQRQKAHLLAFPDFAQNIYKILKIRRVS
jgi:hypothetical protein